jgi:hypothetical protein
MNCLGCNSEYINLNELNNHNINCISYIYKTKYNKDINHNIIINIINIFSLFHLHKYKLENNISKYDLLFRLKKEYIIRQQIFNYYNNNVYIIEYIYNIIYNNNNELFSINDLIIIISNIFHINKYDIVILLNIYTELRNNIVI